jgi:hypothetical protein
MFTGKCSRCEVMKADYEEAPVPTDLLLCKLCHRDVSRKAMTDHQIGLIIEELSIWNNENNRATAKLDFNLIISDLMSIIKQPNY